VRASTFFRMPATPDLADGARPARGALALLMGDGAGPLIRVRRALLVLALAACVLAAVAVACVPDRTGGLRLAGIAAVAALALVWLRAARRGALSPWDEPIELLALFAVGLAAGPAPSLAVVFTGLYLRSLYASRVRAAAGLAVYAAAYIGAVSAAGDNGVREGLEQLPALALGCAVMQAFAVMLARHERSLSRERILREASVALADARDRESLYDAILRAVERLGGGGLPAAVIALAPGDARGGSDPFTVRAANGAWLPGLVGSPLAAAELPSDLLSALAGAHPWPVESPRLVGLELYAPPELDALEGVCLPLAVRGSTRGFLAAFGPVVTRQEESAALAALAGEAALALAAGDAADSAADDRSIERLTTASSRE
jgi:hypothetical protein